MATEAQKRFAIGLVLGVAITLGGLVVFVIIGTPSKEDVRKTVIQRESLQEQARLSIDCRTVDTELLNFLRSGDIAALSQRNGDLGEWRRNVSSSTAERVNRISDLVQNCSRIYDLGEKGKLNGLESLRFASLDVYGDLNAMSTILKYQVLESCDEKCLKHARATIQEAISSLRKHVDSK